MNKWTLKIKGGKYVTVRMVGDELKLYIDDLQVTDTDTGTVIIQQRSRSKIQMAFEFSHGGKCYFLKVEESSLKLECAGNGHVLSDSHWFEKVNVRSGEHYCLKSVVAPKKYICKMGSTLGLCQARDMSVRVTHKKIKEASITN